MINAIVAITVIQFDRSKNLLRGAHPPLLSKNSSDALLSSIYDLWRLFVKGCVRRCKGVQKSKEWCSHGVLSYLDWILYIPDDRLTFRLCLFVGADGRSRRARRKACYAAYHCQLSIIFSPTGYAWRGDCARGWRGQGQRSTHVKDSITHVKD